MKTFPIERTRLKKEEDECLVFIMKKKLLAEGLW